MAVVVMVLLGNCVTRDNPYDPASPGYRDERSEFATPDSIRVQPQRVSAGDTTQFIVTTYYPDRQPVTFRIDSAFSEPGIYYLMATIEITDTFSITVEP